MSDYKIQLENFEGPLDLLLSLIGENKLDISTISLAKITDEYLRCIKDNNLPMEEIADFLVVAAKLLYIKSKLLLPDVVIEQEEEDASDLERQLKIYKEYHDAKKVLQKMINKNNFTYSRKTPLIKIKAEFLPPKNINVLDLKNAMEKLLHALKPVIALPKKLIDKTINIKEKIEHIQNLITQRSKTSFYDIINNRENKTEVIVSFLAMLELMKQKTITVHQEYLFEEIIINSNDNE